MASDTPISEKQLKERLQDEHNVRKQWPKIPRLEQVLGGKFQQTLGHDSFSIAAAAARAVHSRKPPETILQQIGDHVKLPTARAESPETPYLKVTIRHPRDDVEATHVPFVQVEKRTPFVHRRRPYEVVELYFVWAGSVSTLDWFANLDFRATRTGVRGVEMHAGHSSIYANEKETIKSVISSMATDEGIKLSAVIFSGYSLGGGVAQIAHFDILKEHTSYSDPQLQCLTDKIFCSTFSAPSSFYVSPGGRAQQEFLKKVRSQAVNFVVEYDIVPRLLNLQFASKALESLVLYHTSQSVPAVAEPAAKAVAERVAAKVRTWVQDDRDMQALAASAQHLSQVCVLTAWDTSSDAGQRPCWRWALHSTEALAHDFLHRDAWPFQNGRGVSLSTNLAEADHLRLPAHVETDWRNDMCIHGTQCIIAAERCLDMQPSRQVRKWHDCLHCGITFCEDCFASIHFLEGMRNLEWHWQEERRPGTKVRSCPKVHVDMQAQEWIAEYRRAEQAWLFVAVRVCKTMSRPLNLFVTGLTVREALVEVMKSIEAGSKLPASIHLSKLDLGFTAGFMALECCYAAYVAIFADPNNEFRWRIFFRRVTVSLAQAAGNMAGMYLGSLLGALLASFLGGPVGGVVYLTSGVVGGALLSTAAGALWARFMDWVLGLKAEAARNTMYCSIAQALWCLNISRKPSRVTDEDLKRQYWRAFKELNPATVRQRAVDDGEPDAEIEKKVREATVKAYEIQHCRTLLVEFIQSRRRNEMPRIMLDKYDEWHERFRGSMEAHRSDIMADARRPGRQPRIVSSHQVTMASAPSAASVAEAPEHGATAVPEGRASSSTAGPLEATVAPAPSAASAAEAPEHGVTATESRASSSIALPFEVLQDHDSLADGFMQYAETHRDVLEDV